jgi:hypothetical protein
LGVVLPQDFLSDTIYNLFQQGFFHEEAQIGPFIQRQSKPMREQRLF